MGCIVNNRLSSLLFYGSVQEGLTDYGSLKRVLEAYHEDGLSPRCFRIQLRSLVQGVDEGLSQFAVLIG